MFSVNILFHAFVLNLAGLCLLRLLKRHRIPLPPGLPQLPLIGNLHQLPKRSVWVAYDQWAKDLGSDIIHLNVLGTSIIVLNSVEACVDLLDKRGASYSCRCQRHFYLFVEVLTASRPAMRMVTDLMGWDLIFLFMPYGKRWRAHRRLFDQEFNLHAVKNFQPQEIKATRAFLKRLLHDPKGFLSHVRLMAGQTIMSITYGIDVLAENDPYLASSERSLRQMSKAAFPGRYLVDFLPALKYVPTWIPGAEFKRKAAVWKQWTMEMLDAPFDAVKRKIEDGTAKSSFVTSSFEKMRAEGDPSDQEYIIKCTAGTMYAGGADTTVSAISYFFLAMLANPVAQKLAQEEIDRVIGSDQLPSFANETELPYVTALVKEVFRWGNVAPIAPHVVTSEDVYRGMRIPARSLVIANLWGLLHNETTYPEPHEFKPERFLFNGGLNPEVMDPTELVFGFGRRICPGRHMAYQAVWLAIASTLAAFNISKAVDQNGQLVEPSGEYAAGIVCAPKNFHCQIRPRSTQAADLVRMLPDS